MPRPIVHVRLLAHSLKRRPASRPDRVTGVVEEDLIACLNVGRGGQCVRVVMVAHSGHPA